MRSKLESPTWRAFPSVPKVKVWVDDRDSIRRALNLYLPSRPAGRVVKALASCCPRVTLPLMCRGKPDAATQKRLELAAAAIGKRLGDDVCAVSVSPGAANRIENNITAQVSGRAGIIAYVKLAEGPATAQLLDNEAAMLAWLADKDLGPAVVPKLIGLDRANGLTLLLQGPPPSSSRQRGVAADQKDTAFLSALMALDRKVVPLGQLFADWRAVRATARVDHRDPADDNLEALSDDAETALAAVFPARQVTVSASHGDYTPWNCLDLNDGRLFVFDWEKGRREAPLLVDLFNRVYMPAEVLLRMPPLRLIGRLLLLEGDPVLGDVVKRSGITRAELPGYLLLYLLMKAHRAWARNRPALAYIEQCLRVCLDAVNGA